MRADEICCSFYKIDVNIFNSEVKSKQPLKAKIKKCHRLILLTGNCHAIRCEINESPCSVVTKKIFENPITYFIIILLK